MAKLIVGKSVACILMHELHISPLLKNNRNCVNAQLRLPEIF